MKKKQKEDWNYLKQTLNGGQGFGLNGNGDGAKNENDPQFIDPQMLTFHEKVDKIVDEEEELINKHLQYLKEAATLLTEEGELISNV